MSNSSKWWWKTSIQLKQEKSSTKMTKNFEHPIVWIDDGPWTSEWTISNSLEAIKTLLLTEEQFVFPIEKTYNQKFWKKLNLIIY